MSKFGFETLKHPIRFRLLLRDCNISLTTLPQKIAKSLRLFWLLFHTDSRFSVGVVKVEAWQSSFREGIRSAEIFKSPFKIYEVFILIEQYRAFMDSLVALIVVLRYLES